MAPLRIGIGIVVGLLYAFSFYALLVVAWEGIRLLSLDEFYNMWILTYKEASFYRLFFAFVAVIMGQSACFIFWIDRPRQIFGRYNHRKITIINEQRNLNWYFLAWFSKLVMTLTILLGLASQCGYDEPVLHPEYTFVFALVIIVLFLHTWVTIRMTFKKSSLKWMIASMLILCLAAIGLSRLEIVDTKPIYGHELKSNISYNYTLDLPISTSYGGFSFRSLILHVFIVLPKDTVLSNNAMLFVDGKQIQLNELPGLMDFHRSDIPKNMQPGATCQLHVHQGVKMEFVNQVIDRITPLHRISYSVLPSDHQLQGSCYQYYSFKPRLLRPVPGLITIDEINNGFDTIIKLNLDNVAGIHLDGKPITSDSLKAHFKEVVRNDAKYIINYEWDEQVTFNQYLFVLALLASTVDELRDSLAVYQFGKEYDYLYSGDKRFVEKQYPFNVLEMPD
jgi:hypothetical protein